MPIRMMSLILISIFIVCHFRWEVAYAQTVGSNGNQQSAVGPRKQMATIIFAGLAGAILGLSTLSFYGRPQDKLSNIVMGLAVGIISGTVYTTYLAATKPKTYFEGLVPQVEEQAYQVARWRGERRSEVFSPRFTLEWTFD